MGSQTHRSDLSSTATKNKGRWPAWASPGGRKQPIIFFFFLLMCRLELLHGFDYKGSSRSAGALYNYSSILDDVVKSYSDPRSIIGRTSVRAKGIFRNLWLRGRERSVSMVEGVRASYKLRGGGDSSSRDRRLPSSTDFDMLGRSFTMLMAWIVFYQAAWAGVVAHRRSFFGLAVRLAKSDTISAVRTIQTILDSVDDHGVVDVFNNYPIQELIAAIYALSRLQAASEFHNDTVYGETGTFHPMKDFPLLEDDELLEELCHYASFASAAYGWWLDLATAGRFHRGDLHAVLRMTKIDPEDVVKVDWESRANRPAFFIARDRQRKRIVLSIRGTWSAHDILTDLCCTPEEYFVSSRRHRAHNGMLGAARAVKALAEEIIEKELNDNPEYTLLLVGHSLGGSVAAILGQIWSDYFRGVTVYTYGPACVAPMNDMNSDKIVSVLLEGDPFSSVSLGHVADTSRALAYLCDEDDLRTAILTVTDGPLDSLDKEDLQWCSDKMEDIRKHMTGEKMYPPGRLLFLSDPEGKKGPPVIQEIPPNEFDELKISARMFDLSRHVPRVYQRRLKNALRSRISDPNR